MGNNGDGLICGSVEKVVAVVGCAADVHTLDEQKRDSVGSFGMSWLERNFES